MKTSKKAKTIKWPHLWWGVEARLYKTDIDHMYATIGFYLYAILGFMILVPTITTTLQGKYFTAAFNTAIALCCTYGLKQIKTKNWRKPGYVLIFLSASSLVSTTPISGDVNIYNMMLVVFSQVFAFGILGIPGGKIMTGFSFTLIGLFSAKILPIDNLKLVPFIISTVSLSTIVYVFLSLFLSIMTKLYNQSKDNENKAVELANKNKYMASKMQSLLANIRQGLFYIEDQYDPVSGSYFFGRESSSSFKEIFETNKSYCKSTLTDFFKEQTDLSDDKIQLVNSSITSILGGPSVTFMANSSNLPKIATLKNGKIVDFEWSPVLSPDDEVEQLLVTVTDNTQKQKQFEKNLELQIKIQLMGIGIGKFNSFFQSTTLLLASNEKNMDYDHVFRSFHTIKGNARILDLSFIVDAAHEAEAALKNDQNMDILKLNQQITDTLKKYKEISSEIGFEHNKFDSTLFGRLSTIRNGLEKIAKDLHKPPPNLNINGRVDLEVENYCEDILNHLVKNSFDHGIENPSSRIASGKDPEGNINVNCRYDMNNLTIKVSDDGKGLNLRALSKNVSDRDSDEIIAQSIFSPGISTAQNVTHISGRGVGMDAVKKIIEDHCGTVDIVFTGPRTGDFRPFEIILVLPLQPKENKNTHYA